MNNDDFNDLLKSIDQAREIHKKYMRKKAVMVLSGGGLRGICIESAFCKAIEDSKLIQPIAFYGTSAGAITSAFAAIEGGSSYLYNIILNSLSTKDLISKNLLGWLGFVFNIAPYPNKKIKKVLEKLLIIKDFKDFEIPVSMTVTDQNTMSSVDITEGSVLDAAMASSASPLHFPSYKIGNKKYVDGGVFNNIPLKKNLKERHPEAECVIVLTCGHEKATEYGEQQTRIEFLYNAVLHWRRQEYRDEVSDYSGQLPMLNIDMQGFENVKLMEINHEMMKCAYQQASKEILLFFKGNDE
jgi:predicted acylesterase/phospholipase RssA